MLVVDYWDIKPRIIIYPNVRAGFKLSDESSFDTVIIFDWRYIHLNTPNLNNLGFCCRSMGVSWLQLMATSCDITHV